MVPGRSCDLRSLHDLDNSGLNRWAAWTSSVAFAFATTVGMFLWAGDPAIEQKVDERRTARKKKEDEQEYQADQDSAQEKLQEGADAT